MSKTVKPFGLWHSPISPQMVGDALRLNDVRWDSDGQSLIWSERRGKQGVIVTKHGQYAMRDVTDSNHSPSGGVGYGGGEFTVHDGIIYFVNKGQLFKVNLASGLPHAITPAFGGAASPAVSPDGNWVTFVHTHNHNDVLAVVDSDGKQWAHKIASGDDFVMQPTWSPDGKSIAYIAWNHPQMPWNGTELRLITLDHAPNGSLYVVNEKTLTGGTDTAIFQPEFSPDGRYLSYVSDASGWWHLYLHDLETEQTRQITTGDIEHGIPAWIQGMRTYGWSGDSSTLIYIRHEQASYSVWTYALATDTHSPVDALRDYTHFEQIAVSPADNKIAVIASSSTIPVRIITADLNGNVTVARRSTTEALGADNFAVAEMVSWTGHDGETAHGIYYPPTSASFSNDGVPPLMVLVHGGPTSQDKADFDLKAQFFASRGFAVLQVNHRGSTGYGKAYMNKHQGNWGVYDVQDSITGAQYLVDTDRANGEKLVIMGGSAGGYTVLQALVDAPNFFKAGIVSYGIANQFSLVMDTHKFEERYSDWLLGTLPDAADKFRDRSPLFHADKIKDAVLVFQGTEDKVVPKNQSDQIVNALKRGGVPHEYVVYEGEGHGFRKPETKVDFYNKIMTFLKVHVIYA